MQRIEIADGSAWPVDPKFNPVCGVDDSGKPAALTLGSGGALKVTPAGGKQEAVAMSLVTANGSVAAGAAVVTLVTSPDFTGTIAAVAFGAQEAITFRAQPGNTLGSIAYTIATGSLRIAKQTEGA